MKLQILLLTLACFSGLAAAQLASTGAMVWISKLIEAVGNEPKAHSNRYQAKCVMKETTDPNKLIDWKESWATTYPLLSAQEKLK